MMEKVEGRNYFNDLADFAGKERLEERDIAKSRAMASYLAGMKDVVSEDTLRAINYSPRSIFTHPFLSEIRFPRSYPAASYTGSVPSCEKL